MRTTRRRKKVARTRAKRRGEIIRSCRKTGAVVRTRLERRDEALHSSLLDGLRVKRGEQVVAGERGTKASGGHCLKSQR